MSTLQERTGGRPTPCVAGGADMSFIVTHGSQGWGNRKGGCEAYGPLGRWAKAHEMPQRTNENVAFGDLLGDHLEELGVHEGSQFIVIAATSRFAKADIEALLPAVEAFVAQWRGTDE